MPNSKINHKTACWATKGNDERPGLKQLSLEVYEVESPPRSLPDMRKNSEIQQVPPSGTQAKKHTWAHALGMAMDLNAASQRLEASLEIRGREWGRRGAAA